MPRTNTLRLFAGLLAPLVFLVACGPSSGDGASPGRPPDLLLISVDTLRADRLGYMGYAGARTPRLDALAATGTNFTQAITPMPRTTPALATLHTGLAPHHHGSREVGDPLVNGRSLAEVLRLHGYRTLAVSANASAGPMQNLDRGFDEFVTYDDLIAGQGGDLYRDFTAAPATATGWATATTRTALDLVRRSESSQPVFLWVFYFDPHFLYRPPAPWQHNGEATDCWSLYAWGEADPSRGGEIFYDHGGVASRALEQCSALYDAEIAYTDHEIGRLIDGVEEMRGPNSSIVVFTADHGENLGEHGLFYEHGDNVHDAGLRVPLVFRGPGIAAGVVRGTPAGLADVGPTTLGLLGLAVPQDFGTDGKNLSPLLASGSKSATRRDEGAAAARVMFAESASAMYPEAFDRLLTGRRGGRVCINGPRFTLCESQRDEAGTLRLYDRETDSELLVDRAAERPEVVETMLAAWRLWPPETARVLAARTPKYKLIRSPQLDGGYRQWLVDLDADPAEETDVSRVAPAVAARLGAALDAWVAQLSPIPARALDPEVERVLRSLGYIP